MLPDALCTVFSGSVIQLKKVTNVRAIANAFNRNEMVKRRFSEVEKLLQAYLKFPVTSATAERSFSSLLDQDIFEKFHDIQASQQLIPTPCSLKLLVCDSLQFFYFTIYTVSSQVFFDSRDTT